MLGRSYQKYNTSQNVRFSKLLLWGYGESLHNREWLGTSPRFRSTYLRILSFNSNQQLRDQLQECFFIKFWSGSGLFLCILTCWRLELKIFWEMGIPSRNMQKQPNPSKDNVSNEITADRIDAITDISTFNITIGNDFSVESNVTISSN